MKYLFFLLLLPALLPAQQPNCDYAKLLREGKTFAQQRQYKKALYKYNSARRCDRDKGEEVDAAIEALLDQVEGEKKAADKALADLRATSGKVVESLLRDAENEVYHLRYTEALDKMNAAADIGQKKPEVARALMEIAFFYAESGRFLEARDITATAAKLLGKDAGLTRIDTSDAPATRRVFRRALQSLESARYAKIEARYYPVMIPIPGGAFTMGSEDSEEDERPVHQVQLSPFQMAETETTVWQFGLYCVARGLDIKKFHEPSWGDIRGPDPVIMVSWYQAVLYLNWASEQYGLGAIYKIENLQLDEDGNLFFEIIRQPSANGFCLPAEAEWEYAARGGQAYRYAGSDEIYSVGWYDGNSSRTNPVRGKKANGFGLYDMSGNVYEWCWDLYHDTYYGQFMNSTAVDPVEPEVGRSRVLRGGSWYHNAYNCRTTSRDSGYPSERDNGVGFRVARH